MKKTLLIFAALFFLASAANAQWNTSSSYPGVTSDGSGGLNVTGSLAIGTTGGSATLTLNGTAVTGSGSGTSNFTSGVSVGGTGGVSQWNTSGTQVSTYIDPTSGVSTPTLTVGIGTVLLPSITFSNDPDTGIHSSSANNINFVTGANPRVTIASTGIGISNGGVLNTGDSSSKMYWPGNGKVSLAVTGVDAINAGKMGSGATVYVVGGLGIGGAPNAVGTAGITSFQTFTSGISPAGTPTEGVMVYCTGNQFYVASSLGDHTLLSGHDPITGEPVHLSWNVYSGIGRKVNLKTASVENFTVAKIDPEPVLKAAFVQKYQDEKAAWKSVTKTDAIDQATEMTYEVVQKHKLDKKSGDVIVTNERVPSVEIPVSEWKLKERHRVNEATGAYEKLTSPTKEEAESKFTMDWSRFSAEVRAAWGK